MNLPPPRTQQGFTLIEMSIVLVIIGLIIGGVLVGQDLISAATTRAQISQIEKYNQAVNTFKTKYSYVPGDIPDPYASQFGFAARGPYGGQGDGNGVIEGNSGNRANQNWGDQIGTGELAMFWVDLSVAKLIDGNFSTATPTAVTNGITGTNLGLYFPSAKIGFGNYVYADSGGPLRATLLNGVYEANGVNYFSISSVTYIGTPVTSSGTIASNANIPVHMAYNIDKKIDDGLPQSGNVTANYFNEPNSNQPTWAGTTNNGAAYNTATAGSSSSCFDNASGSGPQQYSTEISNGSGPNCALSFQMQGAAR